jgi:hypothetical protein
MKNFKFVMTLFAGALFAFAQPAQLASVPGVSVAVQTSSSGVRQIIVTNGTTKTIMALALASDVNVPAPANPPVVMHGSIMRTSFIYDAAINSLLNPIAPGTTTISIPLAKGGMPVVVAAAYADGSGVGDTVQLAKVALLRQATYQNLKAVIADVQAAIAAKTVEDYIAIMVTKAQSIAASAPTSGSSRPAIESTYGDLARFSQANASVPFQTLQGNALTKLLSTFQKRLATLQQLAPGL